MVLTVFVSCDAKTDGPVMPPEQESGELVPINIALSVETRATDIAYEAGDKVGIYVSYNESLYSKGNYVDNQCFILTDTAWTSSNKIYWADQTAKADFYCYYPYVVMEDARAFQFNVKSDQSVIDDYKSSDFLWGKTDNVFPSTAAVPIRTAHIMSKILLYLKAGDGFSDKEFAAANKSVKMSGLKTNSTIDISSGSVNAIGEDGEMIPYWTGEHYEALVVPQSISAENNLIIVTIGNDIYTLAKEFVFSSKTMHKLTVVVNKVSSSLDISIENWISEDDEHVWEAD